MKFLKEIGHKWLGAAKSLQMTDGNLVTVRQFGDEKKPPILLAHPFSANSLMWLPFIAGFLKEYRFIAPDFRGFGKSLFNVKDSSVLDVYCRDLRDILNALEIQKIPMVGHSMGALILMNYIANFEPHRVQSLLTIDQAPKVINNAEWSYGCCPQYQDELIPTIVRWATTLKEVDPKTPFKNLDPQFQKDLTHAMEIFIEHGTENSAWLSIRKALKFIKPLNYLIHWKVSLKLFESYYVNDYDFTQEMLRAKMPITACVGSLSSMYPPEGQRILAKNPNVRIIEFEKSGHALMFNEFAKFKGVFENFLVESKINNNVKG